LADLDRELEEAAATLGAGRLQTTLRVILPPLVPALLTGFALALARAIGEYGSVIFIAGNIPFVSEIAPLLIVIRLEEFNYAGATVIATVMLAISFAMLLIINVIQAWSRRRLAHGVSRAEACAGPPPCRDRRDGRGSHCAHYRGTHVLRLVCLPAAGRCLPRSLPDRTAGLHRRHHRPRRTV